MASHILADTRSIPQQTRSRDCSLFASQLFCNHCYCNSRCKRKTEHGVTLIDLVIQKAIISGNLCFLSLLSGEKRQGSLNVSISMPLWHFRQQGAYLEAR